MVGIFSRFGRTGHRRTQSAIDGREALPQVLKLLVQQQSQVLPLMGSVAVEFKPVEHPIEPQDSDHPIECPLSEPSILNDGRIWKERASAGMRRRTDLPVMKDESTLILNLNLLMQNRAKTKPIA